jgi:hypothetical protein
MGVSPASSPTPNKGYEAAALQKLSMVAKMLQDILPMVGATSDIGKGVLELLNKAVKLVPSGSSSPAADRNTIDQMAMKNAENAKMSQQLQQQGAGGQPKPPMQPPGMAA